MHRLEPPLFGLFDGWWRGREQGGETELWNRGAVRCLCIVCTGGVGGGVQNHQIRFNTCEEKRKEKEKEKIKIERSLKVRWLSLLMRSM